MIKKIITKYIGSSRLLLTLGAMTLACMALLFSFKVRPLTTQEVTLISAILGKAAIYVGAETARKS